MADYSVSLYDAHKFEGTPAEAVRAAGFSFEDFSAHPISDECRFYGVTGPSEVPDWMRPLDARGAD